MINQAMNIAFGRISGIGFLSIQKDGQSSLKSSRNQGHQGLGFHIRNQVGPDLSAPAQNPEN